MRGASLKNLDALYEISLERTGDRESYWVERYSLYVYEKGRARTIVSHVLHQIEGHPQELSVYLMDWDDQGQKIVTLHRYAFEGTKDLVPVDPPLMRYAAY